MGYLKDEEITITFGGLKSAQNEAFKDGINFAASQIGYYLKDEITVQKIVNFLGLIAETELYSTDDQEEGCHHLPEDCGTGGCEESCTCEEDCGADDCEAACDCEGN